MDKRENFSTRFFEPETTDKAHKTQNHEEKRPIHETPEEIKIETEEIDSYPEKCLWDNIRLPERHTHPNSSSEERNVDNIQTETSHVRIVEYFCDIDTEGVNPSGKKDEEKSKLSIRCMNSCKYFCLPLEQETDREKIEPHTKWPEHKCFFFLFDAPHTIAESELQMKPDDIENRMSYRKSSKWDDVGKWYWEKKPGKKKSFWITLEVIELSIESNWCSDEKNSEENKASTENRKIFFYFWQIITTNERNNWEECDEDELAKMSEWFPVTCKEENKSCPKEQSPKNGNNQSKTTRTSISLFCLYISEHDLVLFLCDNLTREPTVEESMDIHRYSICQVFQRWRIFGKVK